MHERHDANRFLGLLAAGLAILSCSIICGAGCDFIEPGECLGVRELFGPCDPMAIAPGGCNDDLLCKQTKKGNICLPPASAADDFDAAMCAAWRGTMACSNEADTCFLTCAGPDDCEGGTVCDEVAGMCVYPNGEAIEQPEPTNTFGACDDFGACQDGHTCVQRSMSGLSGSICLPACAVCGDADVVDQSSMIGPKLPICIANDLCATPCQAQDDCDGDAVCMDGICVRVD